MTEESVIWDLKDIKSKDSEIKWTAVSNLSKFLSENPNNFRSRMIIKSFLSILNDPHDGIRETIFSSLMRNLQPKQFEGLIKRGLEDKSPSIRSLSLEWLNTTNHPTITTQAIASLQDPSEAVRKIALDIIVARDIKGVEQRLLELLRKEKGGLRRTVIYALGKIHTVEAVGTLIEIMRNQEFDDWTRNQASSALEHLGGKELIIPFIENLTDENDYVRQTAAAFLKKNETDVISAVLMKGKLDYVALLQYATSATKQDFSGVIKALTTQMTGIIQSLTSQLKTRDQFSISELSEEWGASPVAVRIILNNFLDLRLFPQQDNLYYTEMGLKNILIKELQTTNSLYLKDISGKSPFDTLEPMVIKEILDSIENIQCVSVDLYTSRQTFAEITEEFKASGQIPLKKISSNLNQPIEIITEEFTKALIPTDEGWINNQGEFLTLKFIGQEVQNFLSKYHIISIESFLQSLGEPNIDHTVLRRIIERYSAGKWLDDIQVYITAEEFQEIAKNAVKIDEDLVKHLIEPINTKFQVFLESLQKVLDISTYQSSKGQLVSLENLYPLIQQEIREKRYFPIEEFLKNNSLELNVKPVILEYLNQNYQGMTDDNSVYFFTNEILRDVQKQFQNQTRINYSVLGFKLNLQVEILQQIVIEILKISGIHNNLGEFITLEGIRNEYRQIIAHKAEFPTITLLEILEVVKNQKAIKTITEIIKQDPAIHLSVNEKQVWTHRRAIEIVNRFLKRSSNLTRKSISLSEISQETEVSQQDITNIINMLAEKNLVPGNIRKGKYLP
jgi:hypothetical protein